MMQIEVQLLNNVVAFKEAALTKETVQQLSVATGDSMAMDKVST